MKEWFEKAKEWASATWKKVLPFLKRNKWLILAYAVGFLSGSWLF